MNEIRLSSHCLEGRACRTEDCPPDREQAWLMNERAEEIVDPKVIIAYDGSSNGNDALALGGDLCEALDASPLVAVVAEFPTYLMDPLEFGLALDEYADPLLDEARRRLDRSDVESRKLLGSSPARALHGLAEQIEPAVLVIGSAHSGFFGRVRVGRVGKQLLSGAPCPIAVAPHGFSERPRAPFRRVAVAIDEGQESELALQKGSRIAERTSAELTIVNVLEFPLTTYGPFSPPVVADMDGIQTRYTAHLLEDAASRVPDGLPVKVEGVVGDPGGKLAELSENTDLLVVGSRSYGPIRRVLLGSVSAHLVNHAHCPLLVTPRRVPNAADEIASTSGAQAVAAR